MSWAGVPGCLRDTAWPKPRAPASLLMPLQIIVWPAGGRLRGAGSLYFCCGELWLFCNGRDVSAYVRFVTALMARLIWLRSIYAWDGMLLLAGDLVPRIAAEPDVPMTCRARHSRTGPATSSQRPVLYADQTQRASASCTSLLCSRPLLVDSPSTAACYPGRWGGCRLS